MEQKLKKIEDRVIRDAKEFCMKYENENKEKVLSQLEEKRKALVARERERVETARAQSVQAAAQEIERATQDAARELLVRREQIVSELEAALTERLAEFSKTKEYKEYLAQRVQKVREIAQGSAIEARVLDLSLEKALDGICVKRGAPDMVGGVVFEIKERGILVDYSFRTIVKEVMSDFHEIQIP